MLKAVQASLAFMSARERRKWLTLIGLRSLLSLLDLAGILAIGFIVTSTAIFLTVGSDPNRVVEFSGLRIPAVNAQTLPWASAMVLVIFLAKAVFSLILTKKGATFVATIEARAARTIAEICFGGNLANVRKRSREDVMYAIQVGSPSAFNILLNAVNVFTTEATLFLVVCTGFMFVSPWATLAAVAYFAIVVLIIQYFVGSLLGRAEQVAAKGSVLANKAISDLLAVFRELLVLGARQKYLDKIYKARVSAANSAATQYYLSGMPRYIIEAALLVGVALFVLAQSLSGDLVKSAATIGVFLSGGFRLTAALLPLQNALLTINSAIPNAKTAQDILAETSHPQAFLRLNFETQQPNRVEDSGPSGVIFDNVSFSYPDTSETALNGISFTIRPGTQVAFMGPSGAGKSTIADLLCQALIPTSGSILKISGDTSIGEFGPSNRVSYVPQRPGLVSGTILDNVALAVDEAKVDRPQALEALRLAHLSELVTSLPEGLDTPLGKLQDGLSGGQMQRLGLARALYSKPGLLVMDEATSALDAESESEIQNALNDMRGKVTVVLIAHRLNTIQHADQVILIEKGTLQDSGTFRELLARNPSVENVVRLMKVDED
jgi:ATP-binding cassette subfamily C protein